MSQAKERPILFSGPMVRAILDGRKTVTRRPVKGNQIPQLDYPESAEPWVAVGQHHPRYGFTVHGKNEEACAAKLGEFGSCPYGQPGDRLWVRETFFINDFREANVPVDQRANVDLVYRADPLPDWEGEESLITWRPSIHMPRWVSRILLEITDVRVERLQSISESQAEAEGVEQDSDGWFDYQMPSTQCCSSAGESFQTLWSSINGVESWRANPWVWVVEFKRIQPFKPDDDTQ